MSQAGTNLTAHFPWKDVATRTSGLQEDSRRARKSPLWAVAWTLDRATLQATQIIVTQWLRRDRTHAFFILSTPNHEFVPGFSR
jgi:hypothetical protein